MSVQITKPSGTVEPLQGGQIEVEGVATSGEDPADQVEGLINPTEPIPDFPPEEADGLSVDAEGNFSGQLGGADCTGESATENRIAVWAKRGSQETWARTVKTFYCQPPS